MRFLLIILAFVPVLLFAQQDPQFTFNNDYNAYVSPSLMVNDHKLNVVAQHRQQWVGFEGRPITTLASASYRIDKAWSAFGVSVLYDILGAQKSGNAIFNYAFDGKIGEHHIIPGIQLGMLFNTLDGSKLDPIQQNDPNIISGKSKAYVFDLGLSLAYRWRGLVASFSTKHLTAPKVEFEEGNSVSEFSVARHYYGLVAYEGRFGKFRFKPISFVKSDGASVQFDQFIWLGACNLTKYFDGFSLGTGYRIDDAIMVGAQFEFKWFAIGYSYDITTSGLKNYSSGSHEIYLRVHLFKDPEPTAVLED